MSKTKKIYITLLALSVLGMGACKKLLPSDKDAFNKEARFTQSTYRPILGRTTVMTNNFDTQNSSLPLTFRIVAARNSEGFDAPELFKPFPVSVWKKAYDGSEKSLAEIEAKRTIEQHPLFEIRKHSGEFILWKEAGSNLLKALPDSGYVFDVEVSNSGGRKYFNNLKLQPYRERPYEPNNIDAFSGNLTGASINPLLVDNMLGTLSNAELNASDIDISFYRKGDGNSLSFKFLDTLLAPINPNKFKTTKWEKLIHGFNMQKTAEAVTYEVAYPIPCVQLPTPYTTPDGRQATVNFSYDRIGFGGKREVATMKFNFAIFQKGSWEIIIWFKRENPKFEDD